MNKSLIIIIIFLSVVGLSLLGFYLFSQNQIKPEQPIPEQTQTEEKVVDRFVENPEKGQLGYQEPQTKIEIGTQGVTKGTFEKIEDGNIFLRDGDTLTQLPLTTDEVAFDCTTQDLSSATELDFDQVTKVQVTTSSELQNLIPANENIVVFAQEVEGVNRAHTIAIDASKCSP
ncbi:hypothetical protein A3I50_03525 [Candidatus Roizmanbacteria bacterium RIFCSPLOWO2_02_FULL_37_9]|uniref:Uncharacterized protein n=1 Tax=Candidatus Roizmanbacteria bacterium RIFCSPLOWO2_01_FULL_37_16 TaxID=1802058 RepID=A0A1F7IQB3_9BACT|nr:MAG: hypothetical protein A2859_00620 [Candidatus Roizmanbacteria bacterium RIFCSPHIGHO2_01_FULL_37_16b]OGK31707.1 MAG: hypothetical protein A3F57_03900 [Candidatus Roizmanbacteria bacterium RIFCSPHIGHO2_12_FULL_36_11]OGK45559.1 MAG: hypothetical protein A3B40_01145 [Candidatus Roizmanbacteria bacterium RIFCSPLOWO2_01_FULL_37_16]OGK56268.1 MAG: hypothetical protein A3I50_03525 [Candidatus Roizmanbacteria bacterium RIFCSPLOWO2_02_FULL_37_9]